MIYVTHDQTLANEKPQGETVDYDELLKTWAAAKKQ
jgi:hypothetical protein